MAIAPVRMEFRLALSDVGRRVDRRDTVVLGRHPSETMQHVILRMLSWCLLWEDGLVFGEGVCNPEAADLWVPTGDRARLWIDCGARWEHLRKAIRANAGARAHAVFSDLRRRDELLAEIAHGPKEAAALTVWTLDRQLVDGLATREAHRQKWNVTIVDGHCYVEADGVTFDGPCEHG